MHTFIQHPKLPPTQPVPVYTRIVVQFNTMDVGDDVYQERSLVNKCSPVTMRSGASQETCLTRPSSMTMENIPNTFVYFHFTLTHTVQHSTLSNIVSQQIYTLFKTWKRTQNWVIKQIDRKQRGRQRERKREREKEMQYVDQQVLH